ncbi:hypothetical protein CIB48_g849 [Xylaria polymorpha]|nr:hypothetical protein CIB48_g849 [Xylaria polymorpha]
MSTAAHQATITPHTRARRDMNPRIQATAERKTAGITIPPVSSRYPQYQYQQEPITVYRREGEGVHYVESRSGGYGGSYGPSGSSYFPSTRETSTWETGYRNGEASYSTGPRPPHDTVNEPANNVPLPIQQAITRGEEAMKTLRDTIRVVLLHEWCMSNGEIYPPDDDFKTAIKVIPVQRHKHGALQPIESTRSKWGVKTGYHPEYDIYLPTILIRVPPELRVSEAKIKAAYKRLFAEARNELLEDVLEIPFKDNQDWRTYGMLFTFDRGRKYRLFDDYLCEDAVIRLRA